MCVCTYIYTYRVSRFAPSGFVSSSAPNTEPPAARSTGASQLSSFPQDLRLLYHPLREIKYVAAKRIPHHGEVTITRTAYFKTQGTEAENTFLPVRSQFWRCLKLNARHVFSSPHTDCANFPLKRPPDSFRSYVFLSAFFTVMFPALRSPQQLLGMFQHQTQSQNAPRKKLVTHVESLASAVSLLESGE